MDGLSVAASVAGIVSLGIQITQSLVDFYSAYKNQKPDVAHTTKKLEHLLGVLEILRNQLTDRTFVADEQDLLKNIEGSIQNCEECIHELQNECDKFKGSSDGIRATALTSARRLAYPFRQSTLQTLDEDVDEIASHLSLALQVLQQKDICKVQSDIEDIKALLDLVRASQIPLALRDWLKAPDAAVNYYEACKKRHGGTGLWLVKGSSFSTWLTKPNSFLWLKGFAGCGKSVLCSTAIQYVLRHRRSNPRIGIAFFFFTFNDDAKQDTSAMLRALILQLSGQLNNDYGLLSQLYSSYRDAMPSNLALMGCLRQLVRTFDDAYIILDALDESPRDKYRSDVLQTLVDLRAWSEPGLHLLVTSREEPDIRDVLLDELAALQGEAISMKNDSVDSDIASFISGSLKNDRRLRKWEKYQDQIEKALTKRASGVFRWVECQFTALGSCARSKRQLDTLLASLPRSLDKTYERMLLGISEESVEDARRILTLLCCARRPLTLPEIIEGIAVELGDDPRLNIDGRLDDEDDIHRICPGLIEIDFHPDNESTVRLAHFSVQEYLESERIRQHAVAAFGVRKLEAHAEIACICLTYLLGLVSPIWTSEYPLALYAAKNWYEHYRDGDQNLYQIRHQAIQLFRNAGNALEKWVQIWDVDEYNHRTSRGEMASPIYYASLAGLDSVISELLCGKSSTGPFSGQVSHLVNVQSGRCGNALQAASFQGHEKVAQLLLEKGADVNARGGHYGNALRAASCNGHEKVVQLLLEKGADINAKGGKLGNVLQEASFYGYEKVVQLLLEKGADVNEQAGQDGNALQAASHRGHEKVVRLLLKKGADINAQGGIFQNALQAASYYGHDEVVQLLLEKGANVNAQGGTFGNALQAASFKGREEEGHEEQGNEKLVRLLLEKGADVNAQGGHYGNALQAASCSGHEKVVQLLLEKGADINAEGGTFGNALQAALLWGHERVAQLLLERGADINTRECYYGNALQAASLQNQEKIVQLLLEKGADVNLQGGYHGNALQAASYGGHEKMVQLLLEKGADINAQGGAFGNALQAASFQGHKRMVQLLLEKGVDINPTNSYGRIALSWAASRGHVSVVELLLAECRVPSPEDVLHRPPVFYVAQVGQHEMLQSLLAEGWTDPNCQDYYGMTLLSVAVRNGHRKSVEFLLSIHDINASVEDNFGRTPVWWAVRMGDSHVVKLLTGIGGVKSPPIENDSSPLNEGPVPRDHSLGWCDVCMVSIRNGHFYYKCGVCHGGGFWICSDCFEVGAHCLDVCHGIDKEEAQ